MATNTMRILMIASENDALPGAKVGGVGDVLRDLPRALVKENCTVDVVLPSYGFLARLPQLQRVAEYQVTFAEHRQNISLLRLPAKNGVTHYIVDHPLFSTAGETVYCNDGHDRPFATDASKFALFCKSVAAALVEGYLPWPEVVHCHDWHAAMFLVLAEYDPESEPLKAIPSVYTIHNLALQGVRPYAGDSSSLQSWFGDVQVDKNRVGDPRAYDCINLMRAGINLADKVHTVSPSYASEIQQPSDHEAGMYGGEGLEQDIRQRAESGDVIGIINGCEYPRKADYSKPSRKRIASLANTELLAWAGKRRTLASAHWIAKQRLDHWLNIKNPGMSLLSIGRITDQKVRLLLQQQGGKTALEIMLDRLSSNDVFIMLGSGTPELEDAFTAIAGKYPKFIFLNGYAGELSDQLYNFADLFVMPSSFEPCGISQMLAMRAGQPCLVNGVGGLKDTVDDKKTGFVFSGEDIQQQMQNMLQRFDEALKLYNNNRVIWDGLCKNAAKVRFTWRESAREYVQRLYGR